MFTLIWDEDSSVVICATESRKEAFIAILNHLIKSTGREANNPIMWPIANLSMQDAHMPNIKPKAKDAWDLILEAQVAYNQISNFIPVE